MNVKKKKAPGRRIRAVSGTIAVILAMVMLAASGCDNQGGSGNTVIVPTDVVTDAPATDNTDSNIDVTPSVTDEPTQEVTDEPVITDEPVNTDEPAVTETAEVQPTETAPVTDEPATQGTNVPDPTPNATPETTPTIAPTPTVNVTATPTPAPTPTKKPDPTPTKTPEPTPTAAPPSYDEPNNIFRSWDDNTINAFKTTTGKQTTIALTSEGVQFSWTNNGAADPFVYLDISKYVSLTGKKPLAGEEGSYLVFKVKADKCDGDIEIFTQKPAAGDSGRGTYTSDNTWHYAIVDMTATTLIKPDTLTKLRIDWSGIGTKDGGTLILSEVAFYQSYTEAMNIVLNEEGLGQYSLKDSSDLTDNDPLANKVLTAPNEDSSVKLWFELTTERVLRTETKAGKRTGYTIRMAKNETENAQFIVAPAKAMKIRVEIDEFSDGKGNTVPFEFAYEYYHNIKGNFTPDALIPYTGAVDVAANNSQGFIIRVTTSPETKTGTYNSVVHIFDDATGKEVKRAAIAVKVWNFALTDETELRTAFALWPQYIYDSYNHDKYPVDYLVEQDIEGIYYDFFLKYRINIMDMPHGITSGYGSNKMNDPRINSIRWTNLDLSVKDDLDGNWPAWMNKVYYYPVDEPGGRNSIKNDLDKLIDCANRIRANTPDFRLVCPFERNLDLDENGNSTGFTIAVTDMIGYMEQAVNIWCVKPDAFTPRELKSVVKGVSFLQSVYQDEKYGTFTERMSKFVAEGDELWEYIAINPVKPYVNWQLISDGTETITTMWQLKQNNVTGLLYWAVDYWKVNYWGKDPWAANQYGDGFLVYSGYSFDMLEPIPSTRLESIRDGIEDYQMLCMLEDKLGTEAVNDLITRITTSVVTYTRDDDLIHAVRVLLGDMLESALN